MQMSDWYFLFLPLLISRIVLENMAQPRQSTGQRTHASAVVKKSPNSSCPPETSAECQSPGPMGSHLTGAPGWGGRYGGHCWFSPRSPPVPLTDLPFQLPAPALSGRLELHRLCGQRGGSTCEFMPGLQPQGSL